jgi:hypothetical protein
MPAEGLAAEGSDERDCQLVEKAIFLKAEPGRTRFARLETEGCSETEIGPGASLRGSGISAKRL